MWFIVWKDYNSKTFNPSLCVAILSQSISILIQNIRLASSQVNNSAMDFTLHTTLWYHYNTIYVGR